MKKTVNNTRKDRLNGGLKRFLKLGVVDFDSLIKVSTDDLEESYYEGAKRTCIIALEYIKKDRLLLKNKVHYR
jgi:hypothetical protein